MEQNAPGSLTFIDRPTPIGDDTTREVPHERIRGESQVDLLYDLRVPFGRLLHDAEVSVVSAVRPAVHRCLPYAPLQSASARRILCA